MILLTLPDCKSLHPVLTIGKEYVIHGTVGNGVIIELDDQRDKIIILASRFAE